MYVNGPNICLGKTITDLPAGTYGSHAKYKTGKLEFDFGTAKYVMNNPDEEEKPPEERPNKALKMQGDICYGADAFVDHDDMHESWVRRYSGWPCAGTAISAVKAGEAGTFIKFHTVINSVPYQFNIDWKEYC